MTIEFKSAEYYRNRLNTIAIEKSKQNNVHRSEAKVNKLLAACYEEIEKASIGFAECALPDPGYYYDENADFLPGVLDCVIKRLKDNGFEMEQTENSIQIRF